MEIPKAGKILEVTCGNCGRNIVPQDKPCSHCFPKEIPIPDGLPRMADGNLYPMIDEDERSRRRSNIG